MSWRVGVDIGGTFTDIVALGDDGQVHQWKQESTRVDPQLAVRRGLEAIAERLDKPLAEFLSQTDLLVHGSTIATNAVIERDGPVVGLICTAGFRDVLLFRDGFKWDRFNDRLPRPKDFVDRWCRIPVLERTGANGEIWQPLDEASVRAAAKEARAKGIQSFAVALLWSGANPAHERRIREILESELPGCPIVLSSDILPEIGEWPRTSAAVLSAYAFPGAAAYLQDLAAWLNDNGLRRGPLIMQINGGCASVERALKVPVSLLASGPAAAPAAALSVAERVSANSMITVDMGGTSFDVCLIRDRQVPLSRNLQVEYQPIGIQGVEVHSIGAGGGSIAWIDSGGALRVGPQSAGALPGPAAYGQGGSLPTVTDANVVLGYMSPTAFLGGRRKLRADLAHDAVATHIARLLAQDVIRAAAGIVDVVNANMVDAIRVVSVQRGIDPRPYLLVAGGGAGPIHAGRLAVELGIQRVLIPAEAGTICAFGMTTTDVRNDYSVLVHTSSVGPAIADIAVAIDALEGRALEDLEMSGFRREQVQIKRSVDARYLGQVHDLTIPVPAGPITEALLGEVATAFHAAHSELHTWSIDSHPVEFLHWRVSGIGMLTRLPAPVFPMAGRALAPTRAIGARKAYFSELGGLVDTPVYGLASFDEGSWLAGPAIVDSATTTVVVYPRQTLIGDGRGTFLLDTSLQLSASIQERTALTMSAGRPVS